MNDIETQFLGESSIPCTSFSCDGPHIIHKLWDFLPSINILIIRPRKPTSIFFQCECMIHVKHKTKFLWVEYSIHILLEKESTL